MREHGDRFEHAEQARGRSPACLPAVTARFRRPPRAYLKFDARFAGIKWDKWDSVREMVAHARKVVRAGYGRTLEGSCEREMVSRARVARA